ncbi:MAG: hypothetical protein QOG87_2648 [Actinomycetota bacterium]|jgi:hypothetical protein
MVRRSWGAARRHPASGAVLAGIVCAVPTLVYAAWGPALIVDDWALAAGARFLRWHEFLRAERPVAFVWFLVTYRLLGTSPVAVALLMAVLNAVVGGLFWTAARSMLQRRAAVLATAAWAVLANRGATRLWAPTGGQMLALGGILAALLLARSAAPTVARHAAVIAIGCACVLSYEGAAGLAAGVVALSAWHLSGRARWLALGAGGAALAASAALALAASAKSGQAFAATGNWVSAQLGTGILPSAVAPVGMVLVVFVVAWAGATAALPSFRTGSEERLVLIGAGVAALGIAPFVASGFPVGTDGLFDRGNLYADVGTALVVAGGLGLLWRVLSARVATTVAAVVLTVLASQNVVDVRAFHHAGVDGRRLLASVDRLPRQLRTRGPLVLPDLPNRSGVSMFVEDYDIAAALAIRYDTGIPYPDATMAVVAARHRAERVSP